MNPILTFVVPCYNSEAYMRRCIDSLLQPGNTDVEVVVVNDGSSDGTAWIADQYAARFPTQVRAVHKSNGGHGSAINAGLAAATGTYFKVVDSDDWLDSHALDEVLGLLRRLERDGESLDVLITNFVYEKAGKRIKRSVSYRRALPRKRIFGWNETHSFRSWQYLLMHSITYRTQLLRDCELHVPEHSFYVDNYFAFIPLTRVHKLYYLDVDFYRYYIGRSDQSVNERVMIGRIDQQININMLMIEHLSATQKSGRCPRSRALHGALRSTGDGGIVGSSCSRWHPAVAGEEEHSVAQDRQFEPRDLRSYEAYTARHSRGAVRQDRKRGNACGLRCRAIVRGIQLTSVSDGDSGRRRRRGTLEP